MAYYYAKSKSELKRLMAKKGIVAKNVGKTNPKYDLFGEHRYHFYAKKRRR